MIGDVILSFNIINLSIEPEVPIPLHGLVDRQVVVAPEYRTKHLTNDC